MAFTFKDHKGQTSTQSVTGTPSQYVYGPSPSGAGKTTGIYIHENGTGGTMTFRWISDAPSATTPTGFTAL